MCDLVPVPQSMHFPYGIERCGGLPIYLRCFASDIRVSATLSSALTCWAYTSKDSGVNHVSTRGNKKQLISISAPPRGSEFELSYCKT